MLYIIETAGLYNSILGATYNAEVFGGAGTVSAAILSGADNIERLSGLLVIAGAYYCVGLYGKVIGKEHRGIDAGVDWKALESKVGSDKKED
ncbi:hypothetical protein HN903_04480 [archaeon]|jgi:hypothetical protein|nr:hypothetical protein [archaeon]MBT7128984.1 hypothetical protein [archaeon]